MNDAYINMRKIFYVRKSVYQEQPHYRSIFKKKKITFTEINRPEKLYTNKNNVKTQYVKTHLPRKSSKNK